MGAPSNATDPPATIQFAAELDCVLTPQALAESFHASTRKQVVSRDDAAAQVRHWMTIFEVVAGPTALNTALEAALSGRFQFYDGLLLATAREAGCQAIISEDMEADAVLDGIASSGLSMLPAGSAQRRALLD